MQNTAVNNTPQTICRTGQTTDALSRFLSNDLRANEAQALRAHLQTCATCQRTYEEMRVVQAGLRGLPSPTAPYGGSDAARQRVFTRLERSVRVGETAPLVHAAPRRDTKKRPWFVMTGLASAAAACAVFGLAFWPAPQPISVPAPASQASGATSAALPSPSEMAFLYQLHDTQHGETASGLSADPADRRDSAAEARANLLRNAEPLADNEAL